MLWKIIKTSEDKTTAFAAKELCKYLKKMDKTAELVISENCDGDKSNCILLGLSSEFDSLLLKVDNKEFT